MSYLGEVLADNPLSYWRLNETSTGNAFDSSGNGFTASMGSFTVLEETGIPGDLVDTAAYFAHPFASIIRTGGGSYQPYQTVSSITVEFWYHGTVAGATSNDSASSTELISAYGTGGVNHRWRIMLDTSGRVMVSVGTAGIVLNGTTVVTDDDWHHIVLTITTGTYAVELFIDGASEDTGTGNSGSGTANVVAMGDSVDMPGTLDEIAIYDSLLSSTRIGDHYDAGINPPPTVTGDADGSFGFSGAASGVSGVAGTAAGSLGFAGSAAGSPTALLFCSRLAINGLNNTDSYQTLDDPALDITGDIEFVSNLFLGNQFPGVLASKWYAAGDQRSWALSLNTNDSPTSAGLTLQTSDDGDVTGETAITSTILLPSNTWFWLRVRLDVDNGAAGHTLTVDVSYDTTGDPDSVSWSNVDTVVVAGTISIYSGDGPVDIGGNDDFDGSADTLVRSFRVVDDPFGTPVVVADPRFSEQPAGTTPFTDAAGREWTQQGSQTPIEACDVVEAITAIVVAPALSAATAFGPLALQVPGTPLPNIEVVVIDYDTFEDIYTVDEASDRTWQEPIDEPGAASFVISRWDTDALAEITNDRLIQFRLYGQAAITTRPESIDPETNISPDEEFGETLRFLGRQHLVLLDEAVVYPARGTDTAPIEDDRGFNWTAPTPIYDHSKWESAIGLTRQSDGGGAIFYSDTPENWPTTAGVAWWIGPPGATLLGAPPGPCYYRRTFDIPVGIDEVAIYFSSDDYGQIYFDGLLIAENDVSHWTMTANLIDVTPGPHTIAVYTRNNPGRGATIGETGSLRHTVVTGETLWALASRYYGTGTKWRTIYNANQSLIQAAAMAAGLWDPYDPGHWIFPGQILTIPGYGNAVVGHPNPTSCLVAVYEANSGEVIGEAPLLISEEDGNWKILAYPAQPPGMTVGRVMRLLIAEAQKRGALPGITVNFTDLVDSAGVAWPSVTDISTKVGTDYLTMFTKELAQTYCDLWMHPGSKTLSAWLLGTRGIETSVTYHEPTDPDDPATGNLRGLTVRRKL